MPRSRGSIWGKYIHNASCSRKVLWLDNAYLLQVLILHGSQKHCSNLSTNASIRVASTFGLTRPLLLFAGHSARYGATGLFDVDAWRKHRIWSSTPRPCVGEALIISSSRHQISMRHESTCFWTPIVGKDSSLASRVLNMLHYRWS